jgi:dTDP-4-amino-4,6-dideoxygalactose transaminase
VIPQSNPKAGYLAHQVEIEAAIARVLQSGWYILGEEVAAFEREFSSTHGASWGIGVANGTDAVELALRACGVATDDTVLTVSHTAVATVAAITRIGAYPLFVDIDPRRYTMEPESLHAVLETPQGKMAKAVVVVHLYGQPADMPSIQSMARKRGLPVIEDCAQAHGAVLAGRPVGTWGEMGCFSFYPTKNLGALGDGGALIGNDTTLYKQVRLLREYGWRTRYVSEVFGLNSRLDEIQAAILRVKLTYLSRENARRQSIARQYDEALDGLPLERPSRYKDSEHVFHQYVVGVDNRDALRESLRTKGVGSLVHYPVAVHQQPAYSNPDWCPIALPHTESIVKRILSLPMYPELSDDQVGEISEIFRQVLSRTLT